MATGNSPINEADSLDPDFVIVQDPRPWRLVRLGLSLIYYGLVVAFLTAVAGFFLAVYVLVSGQAGSRFIRPAWLSVAFVEGISLLVACVGQCLCCAAPPESEARGYAVGSAICLIVDMMAITAIYVLPFFDSRDDRFEPFPRELRVIQRMATMLLVGSVVTGHLLFLPFLRKVARFFRSDALVEDVRGYLVWFAVLVCGALFLVLVPILASTESLIHGTNTTNVVTCVGVAEVPLGIGLFIGYFYLINQTRRAIETCLREEC